MKVNVKETNAKRLLGYYNDLSGKLFIIKQSGWTAAKPEFPIDDYKHSLESGTTFMLLSARLPFWNVLQFNILMGSEFLYFRVNCDYFSVYDDITNIVFKELL